MQAGRSVVERPARHALAQWCRFEERGCDRTSFDMVVGREVGLVDATAGFANAVGAVGVAVAAAPMVVDYTAGMVRTLRACELVQRLLLLLLQQLPRLPRGFSTQTIHDMQDPVPQLVCSGRMVSVISLQTKPLHSQENGARKQGQCADPDAKPLVGLDLRSRQGRSSHTKLQSCQWRKLG